MPLYGFYLGIQTTRPYYRSSAERVVDDKSAAPNRAREYVLLGREEVARQSDCMLNSLARI